MQKWEHLFFRINAFEGKVEDPDSGYRGEYLHVLFPKLGADGWELVNVVPLGDSLVTMFFKRPKSE
jgi:hypothetical protein